MNLFKLFIVFLKIGSFTFGGGFAMIPLIKREVVDKQKWVGEKEFFDIISISQSLPGAVAVNTSIYLGYRIGGILGAVFSTLGVTLPSLLCILAIAAFFTPFRKLKLVSDVFNGINPIVVALILSAAIQMARATNWDSINVSVCLLTVIVVGVFDVHPIIALLVLLPATFLLKSLKEKSERMDES